MNGVDIRIDDLTAYVHTAEEGGYWAEVPALPGCLTQGETLDEVVENLNDAIEGWLSVQTQKSLREKGISFAAVPEEPDGKVPVPVRNNDDLKTGMLLALTKQTGLTQADL